MSFYADYMASASMSLHMSDLQDQIDAQLQQADDLELRMLAAETGHVGDSQFVQVKLPAGGSVLLGFISRSPGAWIVGWPARGRTCSLTWPVETPGEQLVGIVMHSLADALEGRALPSPLRWGRLETDAITGLADAMVEMRLPEFAFDLDPLRGLDDTGRPKYGSRLNELRLVDRDDDNRTLIIRAHPEIGWTVDQVMADPGAASGRCDLAAAVSDRLGGPGVPFEDVTVSDLAMCLARDTGWVDLPDDDPRSMWLYAEAPPEADVDSRAEAERAALAWLRWAGLADPAAPRRTAGLRPGYQLVLDCTNKQVGLPTVQRFKGVASVDDQVPIVVARSGYAKTAERWGQQAGMLLFGIGGDGLLYPRNDLARAHTPPAMGPRPRDCDDSSCRIGCVIEDEHCPLHIGRSSHPDAQSWRL